MADTPDPRFLGGEKAVLTDTRDMALVVAIGWDGAADIHANVARTEAARLLRHIADEFDPPTDESGDER